MRCLSWVVLADYATIELACVLLRSAKLLSERATEGAD